MKVCKHYDKKTESCAGYRAIDQLGDWREKFPGKCVFKGTPPEEDKHNKWCLGYEPNEKGEEMTTLNVFKFSIGEVVQFKSAPHHTFLVVEQHLQVCSGGQQFKYLVRGFKKERFGEVSDGYNLFNEIELEAVEEKGKEEDTGDKTDPRDPSEI